MERQAKGVPTICVEGTHHTGCYIFIIVGSRQGHGSILVEHIHEATVVLSGTQSFGVVYQMEGIAVVSDTAYIDISSLIGKGIVLKRSAGGQPSYRAGGAVVGAGLIGQHYRVATIIGDVGQVAEFYGGYVTTVFLPWNSKGGNTVQTVCGGGLLTRAGKRATHGVFGGGPFGSAALASQQDLYGLVGFLSVTNKHMTTFCIYIVAQDGAAIKRQNGISGIRQGTTFGNRQLRWRRAFLEYLHIFLGCTCITGKQTIIS